jgi:hypothetical protein
MSELGNLPWLTPKKKKSVPDTRSSSFFRQMATVIPS